ncbi:hypothetical protein HMPREF9586_00958 [Cutibacterium acnes HL083PA2]|nr:hypothetical protein HMPREF9586_00958 [Cutibacterium acnes HL083PA2]
MTACSCQLGESRLVLPWPMNPSRFDGLTTILGEPRRPLAGVSCCGLAMIKIDHLGAGQQPRHSVTG